MAPYKIILASLKADDILMWTLETPMVWLVVVGTALMTFALLRGIGQCSMAAAEGLVDARRTEEKRMREANAAAEAAGRAAALEPLNLNPDGSIEEPIIGVVEKR